MQANILPNAEYLLKEPGENETFALCGGVVSFDVRAAYDYLVTSDRPALRLDIKAFAWWLDNVDLDPDTVASADVNKAGIVALYKGQTYLIEGNHRMKRRLELGFEGMPIFVLDEEESKRFMNGDIIVID